MDAGILQLEHWTLTTSGSLHLQITTSGQSKMSVEVIWLDFTPAFKIRKHRRHSYLVWKPQITFSFPINFSCQSDFKLDKTKYIFSANSSRSVALENEPPVGAALLGEENCHFLSIKKNMFSLKWWHLKCNISGMHRSTVSFNHQPQTLQIYNHASR